MKKHNIHHPILILLKLTGWLLMPILASNCTHEYPALTADGEFGVQK